MQRNFLHFILAAIGYFVAGRIGLELAIPPGFASAVWPAAGIALASVIVLRRLPALLGLGVGSFVINLGISSGGYENIAFATISPAVLIAFGAMMQAGVGCVLFSRFVGKVEFLNTPMRILGFVLLVIMLGCMVASTVGALTLFFAGFIPISAVLFTWITWWAGDSIGILIMTPLLLVLADNEQRFTLVRKFQIAVPSFTMLIIVYVIFLKSINYTDQEHNLIIRSHTDEFSQRIHERLRISENKLVAYSAFFNASNFVSRTEFDQFSAVILDSDHVFYGLGWTPVLNHQQRIEAEINIRKEGFPYFHMTEFSSDGSLVPAGIQEEYAPVLYIYPFEQNKKAFGLNLLANPARKEALMRAKEIGRAVATAPITLAQENNQQKGLILYLPVFLNEKSNHEFSGFVSGILQLDGILGNISSEAKVRNLSFNIIDETDSENIIYLTKSDDKILEGFELKNYYTAFGERKYRIEIYANENFNFGDRDWSSYVILTGGFLFIAMFQMFLLLITGSVEHVQRLVDRRTHDLKLAMDQANAANKAKSDFLSNMSHELRTPLNAIVGFINLCLKTPLSPKQRDYLKKSALSSKTLLSLINQSLDYAKIESGKLELNNKAFSLSELINKLNALFSLQAESGNVEFEFYLEGTIPGYLIGDGLRVEQICLNLLSNAFKFTEQGGIYVNLQYDDSQSVLTISVRDTGIGIPKDQLEQVFEVFKQADTSTIRRFGGTGLGLSISRELAIAMGGDIKVRSTEGVGSEFFTRLKLSAVNGAQLISQHDIKLEPTEVMSEHSSVEDDGVANDGRSDSKSLENIRILLVEDVVINQILAQEILQEFGAIVSIADNGKVALEMLDRHGAYDLVLMDIQMPIMDGFEATERIRQNPKYADMPILAMTANAMDIDVENCLAIGMQGHISKPIDIMILMKEIRKNI
ncbi:CHASE domain-containing protein [Thalassolituus sp.]|jgi:signal transduction histidine kinase/CheY-like chemotaxis protein/integral membrane sensor domain MASE1|uniref:CHASE domain-containing protein n=1 Tax=Thalassolituus sp. TaxID=2030822 RepID=UPI002A8243BB|nr:CHASE domain-containing protein [Thalassolituus sp.]